MTCRTCTPTARSPTTSWRSSADPDTDVVIHPLTPDFDRDEYADLTVRSFGPSAEAAIRGSLDPIVAGGRCLGAFDGGRLVGAALYHDMRPWWHGPAVPLAGAAGLKGPP